MADEQAAQFVTLLHNLMSPDPEVRNPSETTYDTIPAQNRVSLLVQCMCNPTAAIEVRTMSAVLLRRLFTSSFEEVWPLLGPDLQVQLKAQLLLSIQQETQPPVRKKIGDALAEFARCMLDDDGNNTWPEVLKFLFESASSQDPGLKESALHIFSVVPGIFGSQQAHYISVIKQMLVQSLQPEASTPQVRVAAVKAVTSFVLANEKEMQLLDHYRDLLPNMIQVITESIMGQEDDTLLKCLVDLAESTPKFLRSQLESVIALALKVTADATMPDQWRQLSLEVIVTLSETAPAMLRKQNEKFIPLLVPQVLALMVDLEDEPDWSVNDEVEEEDSDSNAIAGESALDRLACGLGGKTMLPHIIATVPQMLQNGDWRYRHAALMAISACGEGCHKQMEGMLDNIVTSYIPYIQDPHPRVRYATCNALGQMCSDFGPNFQKKFHEKIVQSLLFVLNDYENPRVQAHAGAALVNFSEGCPKAILSIYLDSIIAKLDEVLAKKINELMVKGSKLVLEQVVTTLASVADTAEEKFINYYDRFMPCLKHIVQNAVTDEYKLLRGKTIECISLIGLAVGREKFMSDCSDVMQLLLKTQTDMEQMQDDDPQISYMISAWARMCKIMGKDFEQYLPLVMGPVLKAAGIKPEVALVDNEDMKSLESDADWQFVTLGDQQSFGIRTAGLEEKATACQMLVCYARELKEGFAAYTEEVVKIMVPLLKFYFHDEVRVAAAESLPFLLDCAKIRGPEYLTQMWQFIYPELIKATETEPESDIKSALMHALAQCIERMGRGYLNEAQLAELGKIIEKTMSEHFEKQLARQDQRQDEDYDEEVEETLLDEDDEDVYTLSKVSDVMHALFGTHKETILPFFEQLLPTFHKLLGNDRPWPDKQWGLCIWDDVIEHAGPLSIKYSEYFLKPMLGYIVDIHGEVRQAASYGIGVMAQFGGDDYIPALAESIPLLVQVIQHPDSRSVENVNPTENAISAVAKICKYRPGAVNANEIIPLFVSWLPVYEDEDEAVHIYGYLCDLIEQNHPLVLGENNANLPKLVCCLAEAFHRECLSKEDDVTKRIITIISLVKSNESMYAACEAGMTEGQKTALNKMLSGST